ncbi:MAG TPA: serine protease [Novosphingobium sp.]|nr:serine protease [Novosphingobium sp.]
MRWKTCLLALPLVLAAPVLSAQDEPQDASPETAQDDPRVLDPENDPEVFAAVSQNFTRSVNAPCGYGAARCPDPMTVESEDTVLADNLLPPDAKPIKPKPPKPEKQRFTRVMQDGKWVKVPIPKKNKTRVGNGFIAPPGSAPWMAQIQRPLYVKAATARALDWEDRQFCGGALIAPGWIVTAAHCLTEYKSNIRAAGYRVRLGTNDIKTAQQAVSYRIVSIHEHPDYDAGNYSNDIALVRFAADEQTNRDARAWIQAIAVDGDSPGTSRIEGREAYFYGWGLTGNGRPSSTLLFGKIRLEPDSRCPKSMIALCGRGIGAKGSTQCHGDSGGPLVLFNGRTPMLVGVVSHNIGKQACGNNVKQGVFTRIASYRKWIEGFTGPLRRPASRR